MARDPHPDAEQLAEYADRSLDARTRASIEAHLAQCEECRLVLSGTMELLAEEERTQPRATPSSRIVPFRRRRLLLAATAGLAAAAALVIAVTTTRSDGTIREFGDLVAAVAVEPVRPLEGRLVDFSYAPPPPVTRAKNDREPSPAVRIAAAAVEREARQQDPAVSDGPLGVAYAVVGDLDNAVRALERATQGADATARTLSDLSAVYLKRGSLTNQPDDYERARAAAARALSASPSSREACFNHALALEYLTEFADAETAWRRCLSIESDPAWSNEVRDHLARIGNAERQGR